MEQCRHGRKSSSSRNFGIFLLAYVFQVACHTAQKTHTHNRTREFRIYLRRASDTTLCAKTAATVAGSAALATTSTLGDESVLTVDTLSRRTVTILAALPGLPPLPASPLPSLPSSMSGTTAV